jgi:hypothetical protein
MSGLLNRLVARAHGRPPAAVVSSGAAAAAAEPWGELVDEGSPPGTVLPPAPEPGNDTTIAGSQGIDMPSRRDAGARGAAPREPRPQQPPGKPVQRVHEAGAVDAVAHHDVGARRAVEPAVRSQHEHETQPAAVQPSTPAVSGVREPASARDVHAAAHDDVRTVKTAMIPHVTGPAHQAGVELPATERAEPIERATHQSPEVPLVRTPQTPDSPSPVMRETDAPQPQRTYAGVVVPQPRDVQPPPERAEIVIGEVIVELTAPAVRAQAPARIPRQPPSIEPRSGRGFARRPFGLRAT